jgi:hypothetical protein
MSNYVLWRRLTETDFNAMHGEASPHGRGGGAMHVALGVRTNSFRIDGFLNARGRASVTIHTAAHLGNHDEASLTFSSNPNRRGGEWLIRDQFSHRHPAWTAAVDFPDSYDSADPIYILVFRVADTFHVRFTRANSLGRIRAAYLPEGILTEAKGIKPAPNSFLARFGVPTQTLLGAYEDEAKEHISEAFDPRTIADGRRRVLAAIFQRLGQQQFRRKLLSAYETRCAITRCKTIWVLEAAHITPYRGIKTNAVTNGLLLRADVHTLFDLALISIEPVRMRIRVSRRLANSQYGDFDGKYPALPNKSAVQPSMAALQEHYSQFQP